MSRRYIMFKTNNDKWAKTFFAWQIPLNSTFSILKSGHERPEDPSVPYNQFVELDGETQFVLTADLYEVIHSQKRSVLLGGT